MLPEFLQDTPMTTTFNKLSADHTQIAISFGKDKPQAWDKSDFSRYLKEKEGGRIWGAYQNGELVGGMAYVLEEHGYKVDWMSYKNGGVMDDLFNRIMDQAKISSVRKKVTFRVPDGDDGLTKFFLDKGISLKRGSVDSAGIINSWEFTVRVD